MSSTTVSNTAVVFEDVLINSHIKLWDNIVINRSILLRAMLKNNFNVVTSHYLVVLQLIRRITVKTLTSSLCPDELRIFT